MNFMDATTYGTTLARLYGKTFWVYRIAGRGEKFQVTSTFGLATNGKMVKAENVVAECAA